MKKLSVFLVSALMLAISAIAYIYFHFKPQYSGEFQIGGLTAPVTVDFDTYGVPHIEAQNRKDLYRAYGYVVAQDRFFQMQLQKRVASGRLSEWFGTATIETDKTLRNIGFRRWADAWLAKNRTLLNPDLLSDAEAWLSGVNECFAKCPRPIEMVLLKAQPEQMELADIFAFSGAMAFSFTKAFYIDAIASDISGKLSPAMISQLVDDRPLIAPAMQAQLRLPLLKDIDPLGLLPNMEGSQSWVIAPEKSASGKAMLANDPHIGFSHPGVWYEAHLKSPGFELYGHFVPVIPFALIGHNQEKAWALTMSNADDLDLVLQKDIESFTTINEEIKVKGSSTVAFPVHVTEWGPVLNQVLKADRNFILHWAFFSDDNFVVESFYDLNHVSKLEDFHKALAKGNAPGLNISWADKEGNIAWKIFGRFPLHSGNHWQAIELSAGQSPYTGYLPKDQNPGIVNPKNGFILSANQRPPVAFDDKKVKGYWDSSERYETLFKRLSVISKMNLEEHKKLFMTEELEGARQKMQNLLQEVEVNDPEVLKTLSAWNGDASAQNYGLGFYFEWLDAIAREVLLQKMSEKQLEQFCDTNSYWIFVNKILDDEKSEWWAGRRGEILQNAFEYTLRFMRNTYGGPSAWQWESLHQWTLENPLGKVKPLDKLFNLGPYKVGGSFMVPNALRHKFCKGHFDVVAGPSTRRVVDFGNPLESWGVLPAGNSGVIFSPYYNNQTDLYLKGQLRVQMMDWSIIRTRSQRLNLR